MKERFSVGQVKRIFAFFLALILLLAHPVQVIQAEELEKGKLEENVVNEISNNEESLLEVSPEKTEEKQEAGSFTSVEESSRYDLTMGQEAVVTDLKESELGPGLFLTSFERLEADGKYLRGAILEVDLNNENISMNYLYSGIVTKPATIRKMAEGDENIAAAINGDFFDINNTSLPSGNSMDDTGEILKAWDGSSNYSLIIDKNKLAHIGKTNLSGRVTLFGQSFILCGVNTKTDEAGKVTLYTDKWGDYKKLPSHETGVEAFIDENHKVVKVQDLSTEMIPEGWTVLAASSGASYDSIKNLKVGDQVEYSYVLESDSGDPQLAMVSGHRLVENGEIVATDQAIHPRTAVGTNTAGDTLYLVVIDGRSTKSKGYSLIELAQFMLSIGCTNAVNFDGGGSTTMIARRPGDADHEVINTPSDGTERSDSNGLGINIETGSGELKKFHLSTLTEIENANRVFEGLHRQLIAKGSDENNTPVEGEVISWTSSDETVATVDQEGLVTALSPGNVVITAKNGKAEGKIKISVLEALDRIEVTPNSLALPDSTKTLKINVYGYNSQGYRTVIEPMDVEIKGGEDTVEFIPAKTSTYQTKSLVEKGSATIQFNVGEMNAELATTIGTVDTVITSFDDADQYTVYGARSTMEVSKYDEGQGEGDTTSVLVTVDFSQQQGTRTANIKPTDEVFEGYAKLDGKTQSIGAWFKSLTEGTHPMVYFAISDANDNWKWLYGPRITGNDWQYLSVPVPQDMAHPVALRRIAVYETKGKNLYKDQVLIDNASAVVAPFVEAPIVPRYEQDVLSEAGSPDTMEQRIAIVSDAQFVARNPNSSQVESAHKALAEVCKNHPDHVLILGDWVDEGAKEDLDFANSIIREELDGKNIPWTYVPGNHEIMGTDNLNYFKELFGASYTSTKLGKTKLITLDSSPYNLNHDPSQFRFLQKELDDVKNNPDFTGVVIAFHHPTRDYATNASALHNAQDAKLIEKWTSDVYQSGKSVVVANAGVGAFDIYQVDGVIHVTNGNAGKNPSTPADKGGFSGWTMLGINPDQGLWKEAKEDWLAIEMNPYVDLLDIEGPEKIQTGESVVYKGKLINAGREVPVDYPVSHKWITDSNIYIGRKEEAPANVIAVMDAKTGQVSSLSRYLVDGVVKEPSEMFRLLGTNKDLRSLLTLRVNDTTTVKPIFISLAEATLKDSYRFSLSAKETNSVFAVGVTEEDIIKAIDVKDSQAIVRVDDLGQLPDGTKPGNFLVDVTITYPDQTQSKLQVPVTIHAPIIKAGKEEYTLQPGQEFTAIVINLPKNEDVQFYLSPQELALTTVHTDHDGMAQLTFVVPEKIEAGKYHIVGRVRGQEFDGKTELTIEIPETKPIIIIDDDFKDDYPIIDLPDFTDQGDEMPKKPDTNGEEQLTGYLTHSVYVRPEKGSSDYLGILHVGSYIEGLVEGAWLKIDWNGREAYIAKTFVKLGKKDDGKLEEPSDQYSFLGYNSSSLYVRPEKGSKEFLAILPAGSKVVGKREGAWIELIYQGQKAYIASRFVVASNRLDGYMDSNVYVRPEKNSQDQLGVLHVGERVEGEIDGAWLKIQYKGQIAYIARKFVRSSAELVEGILTSPIYVRDQKNGEISMGILSKGSSVRGIVDGAWLKIHYKGQVAYIARKFVVQ